jgi:hypothetical protein
MRVIYSGCSNLIWLEVAQFLLDRHDWQPLYWIGYTPWIEKAFRAHFTDVCFHSDVAAVLGVPPPEYERLKTSVLDQDLLEELAVCELYAIKMMDRMDALGSFTYQERVRHYRRLVAYWLAVLDKIQPDLVFFVDIPHMVYDYILYELCKLRGIATMMFEASNVYGLSFLRVSIAGETTLVAEYMRILEDGGDVTPSKEVDEFLMSLKGGYQDVPLYIRYVSQDDLHEKNTLKRVIRKLLDFQSYPEYISKQLGILSYRLQRPPSYLKETGKKPEDSAITNLGFRWFRFKAYRKMKALDKYYHQLTVQDVDLKVPYIFIALSYQPEATTSPKGDFFVNLDLMVDLLSKTVPDGWLLYVKEHPSQFERTWAHRAQSARESYYYDDMAQLENVRLIPTSYSSYDLLDNAIAVATVTGSVGWQAVNRSKPALVFGNPWYLGCEGVFSIRDLEDCLGALERIMGGYQVDGKKVRIFAAALEKVGLKLDLEGKTKRAQTDFVANAEKIADSMQSFYTEHDETG